jgi:hypothetical protein
MNTNSPFSVKKIVAEDAQQTYCCMTEVPVPWPKALCQCRDWVSENLGKHVDGYHLRTQDNDVIGHIYFADSGQALISYQVEPGVGVLYCEWVQRRYQKQGLGRRLFDTFLAGQRSNNAKGILVETTDIPGQMHYSHYLSRGFEIMHEFGHQKLMYLPISSKSVSFRRRKANIQSRRGLPVEVHILRGFLCPYEVSTQVKIQEIAMEFGDKVVLKEVWLTPESLDKYGVASGVLINGKQKLAGGEPERAIRLAIMEEL